MHYDALKRGVKHFKEEGGRGQVCKAVEEYGNARAEASAFNTKIEAIKNLMANLKLTVEQAMQALNISPEEQIIIKGMIK